MAWHEEKIFNYDNNNFCVVASKVHEKSEEEKNVLTLLENALLTRSQLLP